MRNEPEGGLTQGLIPVTDADQSQLTDGIALCLSGGGYRAMLFHLGGIIRLNEMGRLRTINRVSSVSGGSITAGVLGAAWRQLDFSAGFLGRTRDELGVAPIRKMAERTRVRVEAMSHDPRQRRRCSPWGRPRTAPQLDPVRDVGERHRRRSGARAAKATARRRIRAQGS